LINLARFHQLAHWLYIRKIPIFPKILELLIFLLFNSRVYSKTTIGNNSEFAYAGIGCVIHKDAIIGNDCLIGQGITIGGRGSRNGVPKIGDKVYLGAGCRILGPIEIGNNVIIGPNTVVIDDIPDNSIAVGVPAKVIKTNINTKDYL